MDSYAVGFAKGWAIGFAEGLARGEKLGIIKVCEHLLNWPRTSSEQLASLSMEELTRQATDLEALAVKRFRERCDKRTPLTADWREEENPKLVEACKVASKTLDNL